MGTHMYRHVHNTKVTCVRIIILTVSLKAFGVVFWLHWAEINKEK